MPLHGHIGGSNIEERQAAPWFGPIKFVERRAIRSLGVVLRSRVSIPVISFVQAVLFAGWAPSCGLFDSHCQPKLIVGNAWRGRTSKCGTLSATISDVSQVLGRPEGSEASVTIDAGTIKKTIAIRFLDILSPGQAWRRGAAAERATVCGNAQPSRPSRRAVKIASNIWCRGWESNPHGLAAPGF